MDDDVPETEESLCYCMLEVDVVDGLSEHKVDEIEIDVGPGTVAGIAAWP